MSIVDVSRKALAFQANEVFEIAERARDLASDLESALESLEREAERLAEVAARPEAPDFLCGDVLNLATAMGQVYKKDHNPCSMPPRKITEMLDRQVSTRTRLTSAIERRDRAVSIAALAWMEYLDFCEMEKNG